MLTLCSLYRQAGKSCHWFCLLGAGYGPLEAENITIGMSRGLDVVWIAALPPFAAVLQGRLRRYSSDPLQLGFGLCSY